MNIGAWRSLVAHRNGVAVVGGSNPLAPTIRAMHGFLNAQSASLNDFSLLNYE